MANARMYLGEATEHLVVSKLLAEGREVYLPVVDDHGIDILVRSKPNTPDAYQEIQVKSIKTTKRAFAAIKCDHPRDNYWFIFYIKGEHNFWVINSTDFVNIANRNKKGKNEGKYSIKLPSNKSDPDLQPVDNFSKIP